MKKGIAAIIVAGVLCGLCCSAGCGKNVEEITVYMPDGAPAVALCGLMAKDTKEDGVTYRVVRTDQIRDKVTNKKNADNADFCVLPVTAASQLLGGGERYTMLGTVTHGNLYLVGKEGEYTAENLSALIGKTIGVLKIKEVPGLTLKAALNKYNIPWVEVTNEGGRSADKVNLVAISGANAVGSNAEKADCYLLGEPAASAQLKNGYRIVGDLQALYGGGYPQAVLVAKNAFVEERVEWTKAFVRDLQASAAWLERANGDQIVRTVTAHLADKNAVSDLKAPLLNAEVVSRCGIGFTYAATDYQEVRSFLTGLRAVDGKTVSPEDEFFWAYSSDYLAKE